MPAYRLYLFDGRRERGERMTRHILLRAASDTQALRASDMYRQGRYAELWRREDVVKIFDAD